MEDILLLLIAKVVSGMGTPFHGDTNAEGAFSGVLK